MVVPGAEYKQNTLMCALASLPPPKNKKEKRKKKRKSSFTCFLCLLVFDLGNVLHVHAWRAIRKWTVQEIEISESVSSLQVMFTSLWSLNLKLPWRCFQSVKSYSEVNVTMFSSLWILTLKSTWRGLSLWRLTLKSLWCCFHVYDVLPWNQRDAVFKFVKSYSEVNVTFLTLRGVTLKSTWRCFRVC